MSSKKKVGITGQNGFIGRHLYNYLNLQDDLSLVPFEKSFFENSSDMDQFVKSCDTIVHLAAVNRHEDQNQLHDINVELVQKLVQSCERTNSNPHIIFSSSTQEESENLYGDSKKHGRKILESFASNNNTISTGLIIPNVFGPFGKPNYNSVVATFCHKIVVGEKPQIISDGVLKLIYVNELVDQIYSLVVKPKNGKIKIEYQYELKVSELLTKLTTIHSQYVINGEFPTLIENLDRDLFNTFRCYIPHDFYPRKFIKHSDNRGSFVEIVRANTTGQSSFSTTVPGITRGNHFHTRKAERFAVIKGKARIDLRKVDSNEVISYVVDGENPSYIDMPIWHTHNITNIGEEELLTIFWINEPYNEQDADTYFVNV